MIWVFFFSETCSSVENIQFEKYSVSPSTKNLGSVPRFPSSSAQTRCYLVENVKFSSAFQVMVSLRCCLSEFLKKLFHFHKGKGVYSTSRMKSLMLIPIIRLPPLFKYLHLPRHQVGKHTSICRCVLVGCYCIGLVFKN